MDQHQLIIVIGVIAIIAIVAIVAFQLGRKRRSLMLRQQFGPEYERVVKKEGDVRRAEQVLAFRAERREKLEIKPLSSSRRADWPTAFAPSLASGRARAA